MGALISGWVGERNGKKSAGNDPFDVQTVQKLLAATSTKLSIATLNPKSTDGRITPETIAAIRSFQTEVVKLKTADGRIDKGGKTWKALLTAAGEVDTNPEGWPDKPAFSPLSAAQRAATFGTFEYESDTTSTDPDAIKIKGTWVRDNITTVTIPQLGKIASPKSTRQSFHTKAYKQFQALWQAWEDEGLLDRVLTYHGSFVPRFQRGTARVPGVSPLSNHSWGTAFDINYEWNKLNHTPAIIWEKGCVFELVAIAHEHGFYWGGHFNSPRVDGMHFEVAKIV
jgi:hypothetical protein